MTKHSKERSQKPIIFQFIGDQLDFAKNEMRELSASAKVQDVPLDSRFLVAIWHGENVITAEMGFDNIHSRDAFLQELRACQPRKDDGIYVFTKQTAHTGRFRDNILQCLGVSNLINPVLLAVAELSTFVTESELQHRESRQPR